MHDQKEHQSIQCPPIEMPAISDNPTKTSPKHCNELPEIRPTPLSASTQYTLSKQCDLTPGNPKIEYQTWTASMPQSDGRVDLVAEPKTDYCTWYRSLIGTPITMPAEPDSPTIATPQHSKTVRVSPETGSRSFASTQHPGSKQAWVKTTRGMDCFDASKL